MREASLTGSREIHSRLVRFRAELRPKEIEFPPARPVFSVGAESGAGQTGKPPARQTLQGYLPAGRALSFATRCTLALLLSAFLTVRRFASFHTWVIVQATTHRRATINIVSVMRIATIFQRASVFLGTALKGASGVQPRALRVKREGRGEPKSVGA